MDANPCASLQNRQARGRERRPSQARPFVLSKSGPRCPGPAAVPRRFLRFSSASRAFKQRRRDAAAAHFRSFGFYQREGARNTATLAQICFP